MRGDTLKTLGRLDRLEATSGPALSVRVYRYRVSAQLELTDKSIKYEHCNNWVVK